jgi:DNA-binding XRE family transcriptional regulator
MRRVTRKRSSKAKAKGEGRTVATSTLHHRETARFRRLNDQLAQRVRRMRLERGMTIEQASEEAGVEPMTWYRLEHKRSNPTLAVLASIAAVFGLSVAGLLSDD